MSFAIAPAVAVRIDNKTSQTAKTADVSWLTGWDGLMEQGGRHDRSFTTISSFSFDSAAIDGTTHTYTRTDTYP
ncbi:unnamed protein product [Strongylus vulgaris]|uniref:Uncharacterized protein n=1 Tax=Strongylus vulgaris TaxID=40348 RepID=A0A3P7I431_STRVU|nr:unnamed protein product [Strongylus vulgaris]